MYVDDATGEAQDNKAAMGISKKMKDINEREDSASKKQSCQVILRRSQGH
jgi:hypothetical protein